MDKFVDPDVLFIVFILKSLPQCWFGKDHQIAHHPSASRHPRDVPFAFRKVELFGKKVGVKQYLQQRLVFPLRKSKNRNYATAGHQKSILPSDTSLDSRDFDILEKPQNPRFKRPFFSLIQLLVETNLLLEKYPPVGRKDIRHLQSALSGPEERPGKKEQKNGREQEGENRHEYFRKRPFQRKILIFRLN